APESQRNEAEQHYTHRREDLPRTDAGNQLPVERLPGHVAQRRLVIVEPALRAALNGLTAQVVSTLGTVVSPGLRCHSARHSTEQVSRNRPQSHFRDCEL